MAHTRGNLRAAAQRLQQLAAWRISTVTYIELAQGCRNKPELARLKKGLSVHLTKVVPITPAISRRAATLIDELALPHGLRLAGAADRRHGPRGAVCAADGQRQALLGHREIAR